MEGCCQDDSRKSVTGVNLTYQGKVSTDLLHSAKDDAHLIFHQSFLVDLISSSSHKKDGASMCSAFERMIDKAEEGYGVIVVGFCCDNDGGSQRGRKDLIVKRPWLFGTPCCAHQVCQSPKKSKKNDHHSSPKNQNRKSHQFSVSRRLFKRPSPSSGARRGYAMTVL